jgi:hypothetical protein
LTVLDPWSKMRSQEADVLGPARYLIALERLSFDEQPCLSGLTRLEWRTTMPNDSPRKDPAKEIRELKKKLARQKREIEKARKKLALCLRECTKKLKHPPWHYGPHCK